jgi:hypothetical protein
MITLLRQTSIDLAHREAVCSTTARHMLAVALRMTRSLPANAASRAASTLLSAERPESGAVSVYNSKCEDHRKPVLIFEFSRET